MIVTATSAEFNREPSKLLKAADRGVTTEVTSHGQARAALIPQPGITSGAELARRLARTKPDPETAAEVTRIIKAMDEADPPLDRKQALKDLMAIGPVEFVPRK